MNHAIILSGGTGSRMGSEVPKQYIEVAGSPIFAHTMLAITACPDVHEVVVVAASAWWDTIRLWCETSSFHVPITLTEGGQSRQQSILSGLKACADASHSDDDVVIIHDAARPLVTRDLISACIAGVRGHDGCMPVLRVTDTTYYSNDGRSVTELLDRDRLFAGQAPEAFRLWPYLRLCCEVSQEELSNTRGTSEIAVRHGMDVALIPGDPSNFKITTKEDLERFRSLVER